MHMVFYRAAPLPYPKKVEAHMGMLIHVLAAQTVRPDFPLVAASCHSPAELLLAAQLGCDFAVLGPVLTTASHPGVAGIGWDGFAAAVGVPPLPTFALGGLARADLDLAQRSGAHGIAAIRTAWKG